MKNIHLFYLQASPVQLVIVILCLFVCFACFFFETGYHSVARQAYSSQPSAFWAGLRCVLLHPANTLGWIIAGSTPSSDSWTLTLRPPNKGLENILKSCLLLGALMPKSCTQCSRPQCQGSHQPRSCGDLPVFLPSNTPSPHLTTESKLLKRL